jgi:hypothetical protein
MIQLTAVVALLLLVPMKALASGCTIAMVPDTQMYQAAKECGNCSADCHNSPGPYACTDDTDCTVHGGECVGPSVVPAQQLQYILDNRLTRAPGYPIQFATHAGDVVNLSSAQPERFAAVKAAMELLNGTIAWSVVAGNHDGSGTPMTFPNFQTYFNTTNYAAVPTPAGATYLETWGDEPVNVAHIFDCGGRPVLHLGIQWDHDEVAYAEVITRAIEIINENPGIPVAVTVHAYLDNPGGSPATEGYYEASNEGGLHLWQNLISLSPRIFLVMSGHRITVLPDPSAHVRAKAKTAAGGVVVETMFNAQALGDDPDMGDGWLMFYTVDWVTESITFEAYSPFLDQSASDAGFPTTHMDGEIGFTIPVAPAGSCSSGPVPG